MGESVDIFNFQRESIHRAKMIGLQVDPCDTPQESQWGERGKKIFSRFRKCPVAEICGSNPLKRDDAVTTLNLKYSEENFLGQLRMRLRKMPVTIWR